MNKYFLIFILLFCSTAYSAEQPSISNAATAATSSLQRCGFPHCLKTFKTAQGLHIHQSKMHNLRASASATAAAIIARPKNDKSQLKRRKKRSKVDSDDDYCSEVDSESEETDNDFSDDEDGAQSPPRKLKNQRKETRRQYGASNDYGCGIEGCLSRFGHERNVWEHWKNVHKLKEYYACHLNCAGARYSHWGTFRKHMNSHTQEEFDRMPDKYKVDRFPGYPLLPDDELKRAQEYNLNMSRQYKKARTMKTQASSSTLNANAETEVSPEVARFREAVALEAKKAKENGVPESLSAAVPPVVYATTVAAVYAAKTKATPPPAASSSSSSTASQPVPLRSLRKRTPKPSIAAALSLTALSLNAAQPGAGKKPTSDEADDQQHTEQEPKPNKLIPVPPLPLPATAHPSKVLTASDVMNEVPLSFDEYLREKRTELESLNRLGKLNPGQLKQLRNIEELEQMKLQLELLSASNTDLLQDSNLFS